MNKLFHGGVPTAVDVDNIWKNIMPVSGDSVTYQRISEIIKVDVGSHRFQTVTTAWRKRLFREKRLETKAEGGAFHFLTADEAHSGHVKGLFRIGRATGRLQVKISSADPAQMSPENKEQHFLASRYVGAMAEEMRKAAKTIASPKPVIGRAEQ